MSGPRDGFPSQGRESLLKTLDLRPGILLRFEPERGLDGRVEPVRLEVAVPLRHLLVCVSEQVLDPVEVDPLLDETAGERDLTPLRRTIG